MGTESNEGARAFSRFLEMVDNGGLNADCSEAVHKLMRTLRDRARAMQSAQAGGLTIKLAFAVEANGLVDVGYQIDVKEPRRKTSRSAFWLTEGGNLSAENPKQLRMQLRDVNEPTVVIDEHGEIKEVVQP